MHITGRLFDIINRNAGSSSHSKVGLKQARAIAASALTDGNEFVEAITAPTTAVQHTKRKNATESDLSRVGALATTEEWDVPADPNEPVYCLCQRVSCVS